MISWPVRKLASSDTRKKQHCQCLLVFLQKKNKYYSQSSACVHKNTSLGGAGKIYYKSEGSLFNKCHSEELSWFYWNSKTDASYFSWIFYHKPGFSTTNHLWNQKFIFTFKFLHKNLYQTPGKLLLLKQTLRPGLAKRGVGQNLTLQINNTLGKGMIDVVSCSINYFQAEYCHGETK